MLNGIWGGMVLISLTVGWLNGRIEETAAAAVSGACGAVELCFALLGIMCLWTGLAKIGERAGLIHMMVKVLRPLMRKLFPRLSDDSPSVGSMVMNIAANVFGMGNAATPLGIKAMQDLQRENRCRRSASNEMCLFAVLNTASLQLVPTTLISLRHTYGSQAPGEVIVPIWMVSFCALCVGIFAAKLLERRKPR